MEAEIPIQNIYYLLCYSWNRLEERDTVGVTAEDDSSLADLFARVLIGCSRHLFRRGLDRGYVEMAEDNRFIRGRIDFSSSLKRNLFIQGRANYIFDEFSYDVLHNQILKASIRLLLSVKNLASELKEGLHIAYRKMQDISLIKLRRECFSRVRLNRNNLFYDFPLKVCEIIWENTLPEDKGGETRFREFMRDEKQMALVFEGFVRNFYQREQSDFKVKRDEIKWRATAKTERSRELLPKMMTDISLFNEKRKIIIDTKYYKECLTTNYDKQKLISANLYQMYAYVKNLELDNSGQICEGMLLYPTVNEELAEEFEMDGHCIRVCTINLNQEWRGIHKDLIELIEL